MKLHIIKLLTFGILLICVLSCTDDPFGDEGTTPPPPLDKNKVNIGLHTNADDYKAPNLRTGSADENTVSATPWVAVFQGTDDSATFSEVVQAFIFGDKSYVTLTKNDNPCRLLLIANTPATFYNNSTQMAFNQENLTIFFKSKPAFGDAMKSFLTPQLSKPNQTTVPYASTTEPYPMLPMSGVYDVSKIDVHTTIGTTDSEFLLTRAVAKVTVTSTAPDFTLLSATVVNTPICGQFYLSGTQLRNNTGNLTDYLTSTTGDGVSGIALASENSTVANPIYSYESRKEEQTSVIIKATYNSTTYYYRLAFNANSSIEAPLDVLRNKYYSFNITSVTGAGYATITEAKANRPANIKYSITVTDQISYDIVDNGNFYVGVTNSEYILYSTAGLTISTSVIACTITTNATNTMGITTNSITYTPTTGASFTVTPSTVNIATSAGNTASTDVRVYIPTYAAESEGIVTIRLGNIVKTIKLTRKASLPSVLESLPFTSNNVSGTVANQGTGGAGWLSFSTDGIQPGTSNLTIDVPGTIYLMASNNLLLSGNVSRSGGEAYISRPDAQGRLKLGIGQLSNIIGTNINTASGLTPYVGTFHRWNQTGERLIRLPVLTGMDGKWMAQVIVGDFMTIDDSPSSDAGITYDTPSQNPADMSNPTNDATYSVPAGQTLIRGMASVGTGNYIQFRIGLTSTLPGGADAAPRYGVILLTYNNNTRYSYIFVRQGENPDYIMRPTDAINSGGMTSSTRPLARKFSSFNLTDPARAAGMVDRGTNGYGFTDYPSQPGYFFKWGGTTAWYPTGTVPGFTITSYSNTYWDNNQNWETCPPGYHRPSEGITSGDQPVSTSPTVSEVRQSLWPSPSAISNQNTTNSLFGYYADGFFDRREIVASTTGIAASTTGSNADIAYMGRVFYSPITSASLFFPNGGIRNIVNGGPVANAGSVSYNWTTALNVGSASYMLSAVSTLNFTQGSTGYGMAIRCVLDAP